MGDAFPSFSLVGKFVFNLAIHLGSVLKFSIAFFFGLRERERERVIDVSS